MKNFLKKHKILIISVLISATYGLVARLGFGLFHKMNSISYLVVIPIIMGAIPQLIKTSVKRKAYLDLLFIPWISVLTFFVITYAFKLEGFICLLILALPFIVLGTLIAFIVRIFKINSAQRKKKTLISFLLFPAFLSPMEDYIPSPSKDYTVRNEIEILASKQMIWNHIIEVDQIDEKEYNSGVFQYLGIPRPIQASVSYKGVGATRIGEFSGGLKFVEIIETFKPLEEAEFSIQLDEKSLRKIAFDHHVLNGNYFHFNTAKYLIKSREGKHFLSLESSYYLRSKLNFYGAFWGNWMLEDFQGRLLSVIKNRCELKTNEL